MKIGIAGTGVLGRLLAFKLKVLNNDFNASIFDISADFPSCSYMSAGMLSPFCELNSAEKIIADLGVESIELWKNNIKLIEKYSNKKIFFQQNGTLVIAHRQDLNELKILKRNIDKKIDEDFLERPYEILNQERIKILEPNLEDKFSQGLFFEKDGQGYKLVG
jgi:glycine oxidase